MNKRTIATCISLITESYPGRFNPEPTTKEVWQRLLCDVPDREGEAATVHLCQTLDWPPTVSQIRETAFNLSEGDVVPPQPWEAWERALRGDVATDIERRALKLVGDSWAVKHTEKPDILRGQFIRAYTELLEADRKRRRASRGVKQLADANKPEITPPTRRISAPEKITAPTPERVTEMLKEAGLGAYADADGAR